jgi:nickel-dependent lactate racemase
MSLLSLRYGRSEIQLEVDERHHTVLELGKPHRSLSDAEIGDLLDDPIDSPRLEELISPGQTVLIVVPDATRQSGSGQIVNLLVRRLIANGTTPHEMSIIFATGIHRKVTEYEKEEILTPFIAQRIKTLDHDPRDLAQLITLGETSTGVPIELNRALLDHDRVITVGSVSFHYFAGFTGGRKLICPGLGSSRTISGTHKLAFDCDRLERRSGVDTGILDGNAVHEAFIECVRAAPPSFSVTSIVDEDGSIVELYCGNSITSHEAACRSYAAGHTIAIDGLRPIVVASCGGYPHDVNLIQAHKALDAASRACEPGGKIILLADCEDGLGRSDFLDWFTCQNSSELAEKLCLKYQVNGQTAWNLLRIAENYDVRIVTSLDAETTARMRLEKMEPIELADVLKQNAPRYVLPRGAKFNIVKAPISN